MVLSKCILPGDLKSKMSSVPARVHHCVNPAKDREMAPNKSVQGPFWPFPYLIPNEKVDDCEAVQKNCQEEDLDSELENVDGVVELRK